MTAPSVGIDGMNLAMAHGTGVATYGYGVAEAARAIGMRVEGLFGIPVGRDPRLREILFYEALGRGLAPRTGPLWYRWLADRWAVATGLPAYPVVEGGQVERRGFTERLPEFDRVLSVAHLFERADRHFRRTRRFLTLRLPDPPDVMHWTYPVPITVAGARNIYTLHDLVPLKLPYATLDRKRLYFRLIERCIAQAAHIVTVSESSRADIMAIFGAGADRITNTYQHAPLPARPTDIDAAGLEGVFGIRPRGYFLYFGAIEPKKNIGRLIEAYLSVATETPLVIVGARAWQSDADLKLLDTAAGALSGRQRIIRLDYLPRALLMTLVGQAKAVLFPSLYEGFGLPVLEAMQLGTPVITSTAGSLPEVAGGATAMVDPYDVGALATAIRRVDGDAGERARMSDAGIAQAASFTLDRHRRRLHAVYSEVLARPAA